MRNYVCGRAALSGFVVGVLMLVLFGCGGGGSDGGGPEAAQLPYSTLKGSLTAAQIAQTVPASITLSPTYDVKLYKVSYNTTTPTGATATASGLLLIPQKAAGAVSPLLSVQHGTIESQALAPSNVNLADVLSYDVGAGIISASFGFVVAMPDYLGYGDSQSVFHPYVQADSLATATIDMLRASKSLLSGLGARSNGQLFLAGYSEGGYATLATQKEIETNLASEFTVAASEPGSGPYNLSATTDTVMATTDLAGTTDPAYLAFLVDAYQTYHDPSGSPSTYFAASALSCVSTYFSNGWYGANDSGDFDTCLGTTTTANILNSTFIADYNNNSASVASIKQALVANDIHDWTPQVPTRFYYSPYDEAVPAANATTAYSTMVANGAPSIQTATCDLTTAASFHGECAVPYFNDVVSFFADYATDL